MRADRPSTTAKLIAAAAAEEFRELYLAPSGRQHLALARGETVIVAERFAEP